MDEKYKLYLQSPEWISKREERLEIGKHGRAAGPIRNRKMAEYADAVVLFPGGRGTDSMRNEAHKAKIQIYMK